MTRVESIEEGVLAVTITYRDGMQLQLLPAKRVGDTVAIASASGQRWSRIEPATFRKALTAVNQSQAGAVIPAIKLAKSVIANLPADRQLSGYHVEALAVEAFQAYDGRKTPSAMLKHFFAAASDRVRTPIADVTGQSRAVDAYLGEAESTQRKLVSDTLATVSRQLQSADSPERWRALVIGE
jgi:hypothetical protein